MIITTFIFPNVLYNVSKVSQHQGVHPSVQIRDFCTFKMLTNVVLDITKACVENIVRYSKLSAAILKPIACHYDNVKPNI